MSNDPNLHLRVTALEEAFAELANLADIQVAPPLWKVEQRGVGLTLGVSDPDPLQGPNGDLDTGLLCNGKYAGWIEPRDNTTEAFTAGTCAAFVDLRGNVSPRSTGDRSRR